MTDVYNGLPDCRVCMQYHDARDALQRWFDDWKSDRLAFGPGDHLWMTIEEKTWVNKRGRECVRYIGHIGRCDEDKPYRIVEFERGAPPPPVFRLEVKVRPDPEPRSQHQRRQSLGPQHWFEDDVDCITANKYLGMQESMRSEVTRMMMLPPWYMRPMQAPGRFLDRDFDVAVTAPMPKFTGRNQ